MKSTKRTLSDLATVKYGKNQSKVVSPNGIIPIYGTGGLMGYATQFLYDKPSVLIGRKGTIGKVRYIDEPFWTVDTLFYTIVNTDIVYPKFLYYLLSQIDLNEYNEGTTIPSLRTETLNRLEFNVPSLDEQKSILSILNPIEAKIKENEKINDNLTKQCRALFEDWFSAENLGFGNSTEMKLKDILESVKEPIKAGSKPELPYLPIDSIPMNCLSLTEARPNNEAQSSLVLFRKDDILIGAMRVYFHRVVLSPFDGITRTTCFVLRVKDSDYLAYATLLCNENSTIDFAQSHSKGSTMPYAVWEGGLAEMKINAPSKAKAREFNELVLPLLRRIQSVYFENQNLSKVRDELMPKLMSGELSFDE